MQAPMNRLETRDEHNVFFQDSCEFNPLVRLLNKYSLSKLGLRNLTRRSMCQQSWKKTPNCEVMLNGKSISSARISRAHRYINFKSVMYPTRSCVQR